MNDEKTIEFIENILDDLRAISIALKACSVLSRDYKPNLLLITHASNDLSDVILKLYRLRDGNMMNDFTKEELEIMLWYLQKEIPCPPDFHLNILYKIQSMIGNFKEDKDE